MACAPHRLRRGSPLRCAKLLVSRPTPPCYATSPPKRPAPPRLPWPSGNSNDGANTVRATSWWSPCGSRGECRDEFVEAAISIGLSPATIIRRHMIPNALGPVIVYTTLTIPSVMLLEAFLSFLGLGIQPPQTSWGLLISYGAETMEEFPWLLIFPGLALTLTLFSLNFLGDGLRDALDVRGSGD